MSMISSFAAFFPAINRLLLLIGVVVSTTGLIVSSAEAESNEEREIALLKSRLSKLESAVQAESAKTDTLAGEVASSQLAKVVPEKKELKSSFGLGPAASAVYQVDQGLSLGGYGEANYRGFVDDKGSNKNQSDLLRLVGYVGYKFTDSIVFNSEIEVEHGHIEGTGGESGEKEGKLAVEFAYFDFFFNPAVNVRVGNLLMPMGFINEIHEPVFYHGVLRPDVERYIIPATWSENGAGIFGSLGSDIVCRSYVVSGLRASRFSDQGIREGRQGGNRAIMEDLAWVTRADYTPELVPGLLLGGSVYIGQAGQEDVAATGDTLPSVDTNIIEAHAQYRYKQLELRTLGAWTAIDDTAILNQSLAETIGERQNGWYGEAAYNILPEIAPASNQYLAPFVRYEAYDTQARVAPGVIRNENRDRKLYTAGLTYKPVSQVAIKADYRNYTSAAEQDPGDEVALGFGFVF